MNRLQRRASQANGKAMMKNGWNKFEDVTQEAVANSYTFKQMRNPPDTVFKNNIYIVQAWYPTRTAWGVFTRVGIRRNDAAPVHSWSDLYRIKNELFGEEFTALEVYPAKSELVDVANMYWFFVMPHGEKPPFTIRG